MAVTLAPILLLFMKHLMTLSSRRCRVTDVSPTCCSSHSAYPHLINIYCEQQVENFHSF